MNQKLTFVKFFIQNYLDQNPDFNRFLVSSVFDDYKNLDKNLN